MSKLRYLVGMTASTVITVGLFLFMMMLVTKEFETPEEVVAGPDIEFLREKVEPPEIPDTPKPVRPVKEDPPPPPTRQDITPVSAPRDGGIGIGPIDDYELDAEKIRTPETPFAKARIMFPPTYPERCRQRGIEGEVVVQFDVTEIGSVENPRILSSDNGCFDRESVKAIKRWKFDPKIVNGKAVPQYGVQEVIIYEFEDEA